MKRLIVPTETVMKRANDIVSNLNNPESINMTISMDLDCVPTISYSVSEFVTPDYESNKVEQVKSKYNPILSQAIKRRKAKRQLAYIGEDGTVDWDKVPIGTEVLVSTNGKDWEKAIFMKIVDCTDGQLFLTATMNERFGFFKHYKYCKFA